MIRALLGITLLSLAAGAQARTFCCDTNGRMYCDEGVPAACQGKAYREVNSRGVIVKQYEAPLTPEQIAKREAEAVRQREEQRRLEEEERKNRTLLSTYGSVKDIDIARDRAVADVEKLRKQSEDKLADLDKKKKQLNNETEFYQKKGVPEGLKAQLRENEADAKAQKKNIESRNQEIVTVRARYEDDKRRYMQLTGAKPESKTDTKPDAKVAGTP